MAGENLTPQQIAFLDRFILKGWFTGSANKKTTQAYERYLDVEQAFKDAMSALPGKDPRVKELGGRAAGPMSKKNAGDFDGAGEDLALLIPDAQELAETITTEHSDAVDQLNTALSNLPDDDPRVKSIVSRASGPSKATTVAELPAAMEALATLTEEARELDATMVEELAEAIRQFGDAIKVLPADDTRVKAILDTAADPIGKTTAEDSIAAIKALSDLHPEIDKAKQAIAADKTKMLDALALLGNPDGATSDEKKGMQSERDRVTTAMADDWPSPANFAKAQRACDALKKLIGAASQLAALATKKPASAQKMRDLLAGWDTVIGDTEVNDDTIAQAKVDLEERKKEFEDAGTAYNDAMAMPEDDDEQKRLKEEAVQLATDDWYDKEASLLAAQDKSRALLGKKLMNEAVTFGPLAPDAGRPFEDAVGEKLIAAFARDPEVANSAIQIAQKSVDPAKIAGVVDGLCTQVENGFAAGDGTYHPDPEWCRDYAAKLLKSGDHIGDDYFDNLDAYIASGRQFKNAPLGPVAGTWGDVAKDRTKALGGAMLADNGTFDPTSDKAKNAIADLMYNPDVLTNATPSLALHAHETQKALQDGATLNACAGVVNGLKAPTGQAGTGLVCETIGVNPPLTDKDARQAALSAFFTPMDQGPVGSCFTTAPARRLRHEKPEQALQGFAEIASKGTFTSATGLKVPAVTKLNDGGNPLIQSWEFSIASAAATETGSRERRTLRQNLFTPNGLGKVVESVAGTDELKKRAAQANLRMAIGSDFNFQYDPTSEITDSSDGSSSTGRYRIQPVDAFGAPKGAPITTKDQFITEMTETALKALSVDKTSTEGIAIIAHIKSDAFINAVCPGKYKPWELTSGGMELDPTKALFGGSPTTEDVVAAIPDENAPPNEGARTKEVLTGLVDMVSGSTDQFINIGTAGIHSFNALPSAKSRPGEHSMQDLHGTTPTDTATNIQTKVIDPGKTISDTALSADRAAHLYDRKIDEMLKNESEEALRDELSNAARAERPTTDLKPAEILAAVARAAKEFDKKRARRAADKWKAEQKTPQEKADEWKLEQEQGGATVSATDLANKLRDEQLAAADEFRKKLSKMEEAYEKSTNDSMLSELANDLGSPQVMVADTNWGDERTHTFFVAMPDPTTGELRLWKKEEPGGRLTPEDRKWVDTLWDKTG